MSSPQLQKLIRVIKQVVIACTITVFGIFNTYRLITKIQKLNIVWLDVYLIHMAFIYVH